jgi:hypothetical protein
MYSSDLSVFTARRFAYLLSTGFRVLKTALKSAVMQQIVGRYVCSLAA